MAPGLNRRSKGQHLLALRVRLTACRSSANAGSRPGSVPLDDSGRLPSLSPTEGHVRLGHLPPTAVATYRGAPYPQVRGNVGGCPPLSVGIGSCSPPASLPSTLDRLYRSCSGVSVDTHMSGGMGQSG